MRPISSNFHRLGFSFIELLVSTTILAILIGIVVVNFQQANKTARDAKRRADLLEIRGILENIRLETGAYPASDSEASGYEVSTDGTFMENVGDEYTSKTFVDPQNSGLYFYRYRLRSLPGCQFELSAKMETGSGQSCSACGYTDPTYYCVTD